MKVRVFDDMSQATEQEVARMLPMVSAQRREQALRYKHIFGQFCCLKSWLVLREIMAEGEWANGERKNGEWQYNEYGKPYIPGAPFFSISHCKEGIAVAVNDKPIGIDIEAIRHADDALIERTMNETERRLIVNGERANGERLFTRLWTQKEAILKCRGTGIEGFEALQTAITDFEQDKDRYGGELTTVECSKYIYSVATLN